MNSIWLLKLKLSNKFREGIENYLISMNATITSLDAENNPNELNPELYDPSAFFIKKPEKYIIKQLFLNHLFALHCTWLYIHTHKQTTVEQILIFFS